MTFTENITYETIQLERKYRTYKWWNFIKKHKTKKKIYAIEIPIIQKQLSHIEDFSMMLRRKDFSRVYWDVFGTLVEGKMPSYRQMRSNSLYSKFIHWQLKTLYKSIVNYKSSFFFIEKLVKTIKPQNVAFFEKITDSSLAIFDYME